MSAHSVAVRFRRPPFRFNNSILEWRKYRAKPAMIPPILKGWIMTELNDLLLQDLDITRKQLETAESQGKAIQELCEKLSERAVHLEALIDDDLQTEDLQTEDLQTETIYVPTESETPPKKRRKRRNALAVPDTVALEGILRQNGPLHLTAIIPLAEAKGMNLRGRSGTSDPRKVLRDRVNGSIRFHNFGGNVWGLPTQTLPTGTNGQSLPNEIEDSSFNP